jgi:hypothetical protein
MTKPTAHVHHCEVCGRRMGRTATHLLDEGRPLYCLRCGLARRARAVIYPDCEVPGHLPLDHHPSHRRRAAATLWLRDGRTTSAWPVVKGTAS